MCKQKQTMEYTKDGKLWFPIGIYCCEVMEFRDTPEWNKLLDQAIQQAL